MLGMEVPTLPQVTQHEHSKEREPPQGFRKKKQREGGSSSTERGHKGRHTLPNWRGGGACKNHMCPECAELYQQKREKDLRDDAYGKEGSTYNSDESFEDGEGSEYTEATEEDK